MDIEEFKKKNPPKGKRSRLHQHRKQIFALREDGYTYSQIAEYLALNDVKVTTAWLCRFINNEMGKGGKLPPESGQGKTAVPAKKTSSFEDSRKVAEKYITAEAMNPILRRTLAEQRKQQQEEKDDSDSD